MHNPIQAIIGLGNPGSEYAKTRHNAGFWAVDALADHFHGTWQTEKKWQSLYANIKINNQNIHLLKPMTFMNKSGISVRGLLDFYKLTPEKILVIHDELDAAPGVLKLKSGGGHGGHNGLRDTSAHIGANYARLRYGIGHPGHKDRVLAYVLGAPDATQSQIFSDANIDIIHIIENLVNNGWDKSVQALHTEKKP